MAEEQFIVAQYILCPGKAEHCGSYVVYLAYVVYVFVVYSLCLLYMLYSMLEVMVRVC